MRCMLKNLKQFLMLLLKLQFKTGFINPFVFILFLSSIIYYLLSIYLKTKDKNKIKTKGLKVC